MFNRNLIKYFCVAAFLVVSVQARAELSVDHQDLNVKISQEIPVLGLVRGAEVDLFPLTLKVFSRHCAESECTISSTRIIEVLFEDKVVATVNEDGKIPFVGAIYHFDVDGNNEKDLVIEINQNEFIVLLQTQPGTFLKVMSPIDAPPPPDDQGFVAEQEDGSFEFHKGRMKDSE